MPAAPAPEQLKHAVLQTQPQAQSKRQGVLPDVAPTQEQRKAPSEACKQSSEGFAP